MHTFLQITSARVRHGGSSLRARLGGGEDGFLLVEVMMSALLVALIVTATFNGFDVASRITVDQRRHSEAELLAAESQEQLRSDSATALDALETAPHSYSREITNNSTTTTYHITQEAKALSSKGTTGCSATGASKENGANIEVITTVTWALLEKSKRPPVRVASVVTPPVGSALEVDVTDGGSPPKAESGVTAVVKFTPSGASTSTTVEGTTGSGGCIVFTGLAATTATVEILEKANWVIKSGELKWPTKTVTIAPNITTQYPVVYAPGGRLTAQFTYKGSTTWSGKEVRGDTFVVSNAGIPVSASQYAVGSTSIKIKETGEYPYLAAAATAGSGYVSEGAVTAVSGKYLNGDLFPFPSEWTAYAGDCPKNNVGSASEGKATVGAGENRKVTVPLSILKLSLKKGTWATKATAPTDPTAYEVVVKDPECENYEKAPNHSYGVSIEHKQKTSAGELENPFQPFGKQEICVYNATAKKTYRASYTNSTEAGNALTIYTEQPSKSERETPENAAKAKRATEEAEAKTAKEKREEETEATAAKAAREKAEKEMTEAKATREAKEKTERETWKKEEEKGFISKATREKREKEQKEKREAKEKEEKTAKEKRATEEAAAKKPKEEREAAEAAAKKPKEEREAAETAATKAREKAEAEEKELEKSEGEKIGWTVAGSQASC